MVAINSVYSFEYAKIENVNYIIVALVQIFWVDGNGD